MRSQLFSSILLASVVGCGGGGGGNNKPDAKIFLDAPIDAAPTCSFICESNICDGMMGRPAVGNVFPGLRLNYTMPLEFYSIEDMGPLAGRKIMTVGGNTGMTATGTDILLFDIVKPEVGPFPIDTAIMLETDATAMTPNAYALWYGDFNEGVGAQQIYFSSSGSITLTMAGEVDGTTVSGVVSMTGAREIDPMTGADVAGGCTVSMGGLEFMGTQMEAPPALQRSANTQPTVGQDGVVNLYPLTETQRKEARAMMNRIRAQRGL